jgi:squalene-associated FAD-dependent desaturase
VSHVGIIGAGWAGLSAAVIAIERGHRVTIWEAQRLPGGRARTQARKASHDGPARDNGQHLLISAYSGVADMLARIGVHREDVLLEAPLDLRDHSGQGLVLPKAQGHLGVTLPLAMAVLRARGWSWRDKLSLARWAWRVQDKTPAADARVSELLDGLPPKLREDLLAPLCISALNLPPEQASAALFHRVLRDSLWASPKHWRAWLPKVPLGEVFAEPAAQWLSERGAQWHWGERVCELRLSAEGIRVQSDVTVDQLVLATPAWVAADLVQSLPHSQAHAWAATAAALQHTAIATVYAHAPGLRLPRPMLALPSRHPWDAQFVFDAGRLGHPCGHLAAVLSHAPKDGQGLKAHVQAQLRSALGDPSLCVQQVVLEKRATFAASPGVLRPPALVCPKIWACGDHVQGPYPATLEGAVRSAMGLPWDSLAAEASDRQPA